MAKTPVLACAVIVVIALITVPVMAAQPETASKPVEQILTVVKDIQTKAGSILTRLTSLQTDVTTIKTNTDTLLQAPPEPIRYEYYTSPLKTEKNPGGFLVYASLTNAGESSANVCYYQYMSTTAIGEEFDLHDYRCIELEAGHTVQGVPRIVSDHTHSFKYKLTADSPLVVPFAAAFDSSTGEYMDIYHTGDFLKVEIYS